MTTRLHTCTIRVSRDVHQALAKLAICPLDDSKTIYHDDGSATFPVSRHVYNAITEIDPDPDLALRQLLKLKANA